MGEGQRRTYLGECIEDRGSRVKKGKKHYVSKTGVQGSRNLAGSGVIKRCKRRERCNESSLFGGFLRLFLSTSAVKFFFFFLSEKFSFSVMSVKGELYQGINALRSHYGSLWWCIRKFSFFPSFFNTRELCSLQFFFFFSSEVLFIGGERT